MILHPGVIALLIASLLSSAMLLYAAVQGVGLIRRWNIASGSGDQLRLERKTYLISTMLAWIMVVEALSLFLFIYTADALCSYMTGAMCAAGTLNANAWGYPALIMKTLNCILAGVWLIMNSADNRAYDYPLIKPKYLFLLVLAPLVTAETFVLFQFFKGLRVDVITSCCGSLFSTTADSLPSELAGLSPRIMMPVYFISTAVTVLTGIFFLLKKRGILLFAFLSGALMIVNSAALISFISLYVYELPTHHCPFCVLQREYHYVGYGLYLSLLTGSITGMGAGLLDVFNRHASLRDVIPSLQKRLVIAAIISFCVFLLISLYPMLFSSFRLFADR